MVVNEILSTNNQCHPTESIPIALQELIWTLLSSEMINKAESISFVVKEYHRLHLFLIITPDS